MLLFFLRLLYEPYPLVLDEKDRGGQSFLPQYLGSHHKVVWLIFPKTRDYLHGKVSRGEVYPIEIVETVIQAVLGRQNSLGYLFLSLRKRIWSGSHSKS